MRRAARALAALLAFCAHAARADAPDAPAPIDPAAQHSAAPAASEYWDLFATLGDGFRVAVRFTITNEGPGLHSAAAFGHVLRAGAPPVAFQNGRREGRWRLESNGRRIEIGSSLLDLGDGARHFEVDNDKRGVKVFLDWEQGASAWRVPGSALPDGYHVDLLQLATPVRASIQVEDMPAALRLEGTLVLTHTWMERPEGELVLRRIDVASAEGGGVYLLDLLAPAGERFAWLSAGGRPSPSDFTVEAGSRANAGPYALPSALQLRGSRLGGAVRFRATLLEVDPLATLPAVLRMVYSLRGRPHRSWTDARIELTWAPGPELQAVRVAGDAIVALTFLDALPPRPALP